MSKASGQNFLEKNAGYGLALLLLFTACLFYPSLKNGFLNYDDPQWVAQEGKHRLLQFFTTSTLNMYAPLVNISFAWDEWLGGKSWVYHSGNLLLHLCNVTLVFLFIRRISTREAALLAAALFALHPAAVDTVAWVSTRSNLLFTFFFLVSLLCYLHYTRKGKRSFFWVSLLLFLCSCLSKSAAVALPAVLFLLDLQQGMGLRGHILEKVPFLIVAAATVWAAVYFRADAQQTHAGLDYSIVDKFFLACFSIVSYLQKFILPYNLSAVYTYPAKGEGLLPWMVYASALILPALAWIIWRYRSNQVLLFGLLFFLTVLSPCLVGFFEDGFMANRYAYLPYLGLFFILAHLPAWLRARRVAAIVLLGVFLTACSILLARRTLVWKDDITLFSDVIEKQPGNAFAYNSRGIALYYQSDTSAAISDYSTAIHLQHTYAEAYYNRAILYHSISEFEKALDDYNQAIAINPLSANSYLGRGITKMDGFSENEEAVKDYNEAIRIDPGFAQAYFNRAVAEMRMGKSDDACNDLQRVKQLGYSNADAMIEHFCKDL